MLILSQFNTKRFSFATIALGAAVAFGVASVEAQVGEATGSGSFNRVPFRKSQQADASAPRIASARPISSGSFQGSGNQRRSSVLPSQSSSSPLPSLQDSYDQRQNPIGLGAGDSVRPQVGNSVDLSPQLSPTKDKLRVEYGSIKLIDDIMLPALEPGEIESLNVKEGQFISADTVVGKIDDSLIRLEFDQQRQSYENSRILAEDDISRQAASKKYSLAYNRYERQKNLFKKSSASQSDFEESKFQAEIAKLEIEKANNNQNAAKREALLELARLGIVQKRIARHVLKSDYDAYVIEIFKKQQEFVQAGEEVMRLGRMDELWAQGNVNSHELDEHNALNRPVTVTLEMANGRKIDFEGKVEQIPLERQSSDQYAVKVRIKNRRAEKGGKGSWLLRPLARVSMVIHLDRGFIGDESANAQPVKSGSPVRNGIEVPKTTAPATQVKGNGFPPVRIK